MVLAEDLRQAVLQAALQGKLTEQFETDSNVDELLENIQKEKERLIADKKIKKEKLLPEIQDEDIPFDIPENWKWVRLQSFLDVRDGTHDSPKYVENGIPFVTSKNLNNGKIDFSDVKYITKEDAEVFNARSKVDKNDILMAMIGSIGKPVLVDIEQEFAIKNMALFKPVPKSNINMRYVLLLLEYAENIMKIQSTGGVQKFVSLTYLREFISPLPPIEEQQRIVDKINEIMPKIDEYEKIEKELETLKKEFSNNMKDALLQAAMQGKLTEQLESDSSVDELLKVIRQEKEELIAQKEIKKEKPLPDIEEEEIPFDIPENWRWVRLGNVGTLTRGNGIKRNEVTEVGFPCVRYGELYTTYKTKFDVAVSHTSKEIFNKSQKVHTNDILMALTGENNFDIALALAYLGEEVIAMGGDLTRWSNHHMNPLYLVYVMNSSYAIHKKSEMAKGDIIVHISNDKLATILLPIPPIEEQNRIVERLEALLPLCEDLREV